MTRVFLVGLIAAALAGAFLLHYDRGVQLAPGSHAYVRIYDRANPGVEAAMATGDGQGYGALARDPTLSRPDVFRDGPKEAAYRYQRPVLGYLAWIGSFGRPDWEPGAQAVLVVLGAGAATAACAELLRRRRVNPVLALVVLIAPGMLASVSGVTAEPIALAFLTFALLAWWSVPRRGGQAALLFALAALTRESSLVALVPLVVVELGRARDENLAVRVRRVAPIAVPVAVFAGWLAVLRLRLHAWPVSGGSVRLTAVPFGGLARDLSRFANPRATWASIAVGAVLVVFVLSWARRDPLTPIVVAYGVAAAFFGTEVWRRWQDFGRPLLPLYALAGLVVMTRLEREDVRR